MANNTPSRRIVVTGMGIVSPLGLSLERLWESLCAGRSGVAPIDEQLFGPLPVPFAAAATAFRGKIDDFGPLEKSQAKLIRKGLKVMCRECQMGVAAAQRALSHAALSFGQADPERSGVIFGSDYMLSVPEEFTEGIGQCLDEAGQFHFSRWAQQGMPKMSPLWLLKYLPNMPASHIAIFNDFRGPSNSLTMREASFNWAVAEAFRIIREGRADVMLAGATGTRLHPMKTVHALQQEEVVLDNGNPAAASRPFDKNRRGMVLGEGAGAVLLEELTVAEKRGATIYAEVVGGASSSVAEPNLVARRDLAMRNALAATLHNAGWKPEEVGFIHAHGLSTRNCDREEAWAIRQVFGPAADRLPVVAAKSYFGNLGAGSGAVELIAGLLALQHQQLFPVLNYQTPDPDCPLAVVSDDQPPLADRFINLNVTPQGQATAVALQAFAA